MVSAAASTIRTTSASRRLGSPTIPWSRQYASISDGAIGHAAIPRCRVLLRYTYACHSHVESSGILGWVSLGVGRPRRSSLSHSR